MTTEAEMEKWITEAAEYLKGKGEADQMFERRKPEEGEALSLRAETKSRLEDALKRAKALEKTLLPLVVQARDNPMPGMMERIYDAWRGAGDAVLACTLALTDTLPKPGNVSLKYRYHRDAVRIAINFDYRNARKIAERIIEEAGLAETYSEQSMDNWLSEERKNYRNENPK